MASLIIFFAGLITGFVLCAAMGACESRPKRVSAAELMRRGRVQ